MLQVGGDLDDIRERRVCLGQHRTDIAKHLPRLVGDTVGDGAGVRILWTKPGSEEKSAGDDALAVRPGGLRCVGYGYR